MHMRKLCTSMNFCKLNKTVQPPTRPNIIIFSTTRKPQHTPFQVLFHHPLHLRHIPSPVLGIGCFSLIFHFTLTGLHSMHTFCICLLLLNIMFMTLIHIVIVFHSHGYIEFYFMKRSLFVYPSALDGCLDCSQSGTLMTRAAGYSFPLKF